MLRVFLCLLAGAAGMQMPATASPKIPKTFLAWPRDPPLDGKFADWLQQQKTQALLQKEINKLSCPDVPVRLVFEGAVFPTVLKGDAKVESLHVEATRLHNLDPNQALRFMLGSGEASRALPTGIPISESPLANTRNLEVFIMSGGTEAVRRASTGASSGSWWAGAACGSGQRGTSVGRYSNDVRQWTGWEKLLDESQRPSANARAPPTKPHIQLERLFAEADGKKPGEKPKPKPPPPQRGSHLRHSSAHSETLRARPSGPKREVPNQKPTRGVRIMSTDSLSNRWSA